MHWERRKPRYTLLTVIRFKMEFTGVGLSKLSEVAQHILAETKAAKLVTFYGQMGAGKTTLIKAICAELGVNHEVSSPTFSLVNEYKTANGTSLYHFDFYRIKSIEEVYDIGYEDYFYSGAICLIEWPELIEELLQDEKQIQIHINTQTPDTRKITCELVNG